MERITGEMVEKIEEILKQRGWSKKYFAKEVLKKSPQWLNNKLKNHRKITMEDFNIIAKGLNVKLPQLFTDEIADEIHRLPFIDLLRFVCKKEIEEYLKQRKGGSL